MSGDPWGPANWSRNFRRGLLITIPLAAVVWFLVARFLFDRSVTYSLIFGLVAVPLVLATYWLMSRLRRYLGWEPPSESN